MAIGGGSKSKRARRPDSAAAAVTAIHARMASAAVRTRAACHRARDGERDQGHHDRETADAPGDDRVGRGGRHVRRRRSASPTAYQPILVSRPCGRDTRRPNVIV